MIIIITIGINICIVILHTFMLALPLVIKWYQNVTIITSDAD